MRVEVDLIVSGGDVVASPDGRVIRGGAVAVSGNRIAAVGAREDVESRYEAARAVDARGKLVLPGFIDLHVHNAQSLLRGWVGDELVALPPIWLSMLIPFEARLDRRHVEAASWLSMLGMIRCGTTCFVEAGAPWPDAVAEVAERAGLRAIITRSNIDSSPEVGMYLETGETVEENLRLFERWDGAAGGRIRVWFSLREVMLNTLELYEEFSALAEEKNTYITMHLAEDRVEVDYCLERYGLRPVELMYRRGFLSRRVLASHAIFLSPREVFMLRDSGASVAWCPYVDALVMSFPRVDALLAAGVNVGFGSDGGAWCGLDLLEQARVGRAVVKSLSNAAYYDKTVLTPREAFGMLTVNAAEAVHQRLGRLQPGYLADIITVDARKPNLRFTGDHVDALISSGGRCEVSDVVVDGRVLMEGGVVKVVDEERVLGEAAEAVEEAGELAKGLRDEALKGARR